MRFSTLLLLLLTLQELHSLRCTPLRSRYGYSRTSISAAVDDFGFPVHNDHNDQRLPPNKGDLYSDDDLKSLLNLHNSIKDTTSQRADDEYPGVTASLHDAVLAALRDMEVEPDKASSSPNSLGIVAPGDMLYPITSKMRNVLPNIKAIASDVDGTLLTSQHSLHLRTERAIETAIAATKDPANQLQHFFLATGKSRLGALTSLGPKLQALLANTPGAFIQGLYCVDATGAVVYEKRLSSAAVAAAVDFARLCGTSLFCYDGDSIYASVSSLQEHIDEFSGRWGEPEPVRVDSDQRLINFQQRYHKVLLMDSDTDKIRSIRPRMEELAAELDCVVTQAVDTMLELLPPNSSKAVGVAKLCQSLGIREGELLSIGDGENDIDFLRNAGFAVAVGNAVPQAKQAADVVLVETNDDGGAGVAIELFGLGSILDYE